MREGEISKVGQLLFKAPFAVLAHDAGDEPRYNYANQAALDLFEGSWDEIVGLESKNTTEPVKEVGWCPRHDHAQQNPFAEMTIKCAGCVVSQTRDSCGRCKSIGL